MGKIKLFPTPEYSSKQPSDPVVPLVPCTGIFLGPSKSGKTVTLISLILEQHRGVFERIYIFSPSIDIDDGWIPVKKYIEQDLGVNTEREQAYWDEWDEAALRRIIFKEQDHRDYDENSHVHRTGFFLREKKKEPNFAMKLALGLDVQTNAKGGKFMSIEDSRQGALVCKADVEVLWEPGTSRTTGPRGRVLCEQHRPGAVDGGGGAGRHRQHDRLPEALSGGRPHRA